MHFDKSLIIEGSCELVNECSSCFRIVKSFAETDFSNVARKHCRTQGQSLSRACSHQTFKVGK